MSDEWVGITDDLPIIEIGYKNVTIDVWAKLDNSITQKAFYDYQTRNWYDQRGRRIRGNVIAWKSIEENTRK